MIRNKQLNEIKNLLEQDINRFGAHLNDIDLHLPINHVITLCKLLQNIETLRLRHRIPLELMDNPNDEELKKWCKEYMIEDMAKGLNENNVVDFRENGDTYESELLVIRPMKDWK